jgi:cytoskeletal protein RodZ
MPMAEKNSGGGTFSAGPSADFGLKMKRAREERGISLRQIADVTKISATVFEALERNDIKRLPGGIFSRSFVRAYAIEIGLDPEQTVREFLSHFPDDELAAGSRHVPYEEIVPPEAPGRRRVIIAFVLILLALAAAAAYFTLAARP